MPISEEFKKMSALQHKWEKSLKETVKPDADLAKRYIIPVKIDMPEFTDFSACAVF